MTAQEFTELRSESTIAKIEELLSLQVTPEQAALKSGSSTIATQIKYLQRAERKLPSFYAARAVIDRQGFEQCSSQASARSKFENVEGRLAIDLTAGLGVDSYALSENFDRVISVEMNPLRAQITAHNLALLGAHNVEVVCADAESFLQANEGLKADLIYIDPSRVEQGANGRRVYSLEDSSPNILKIIEPMRRIAKRVIIKLSPLFDIDECFRLFGAEISVEVVSLGGECKEVLVRIGWADRSSIINTILRKDSKEQYRYLRTMELAKGNDKVTEARYLSVADVSLLKSRTLNQYLRTTYPNTETNTEGYVISAEPLVNFAGQSFRITSVEPYAPKKIRKRLKELGITRATIAHYLFPYSSEQIARDLGLRSGGTQRLFFSIYQGRPTIFFVSSH